MLDTAGWVLYRQGKIEEAEPYLHSSFAVTPRGENEMHMVAVLAKLRRLDEAARLFAEVRTRPNFDLADSRETVRHVREWRPKKGVRHEALDARVYAYAALRALVSMGLVLDAEVDRIAASTAIGDEHPASRPRIRRSDWMTDR